MSKDLEIHFDGHPELGVNITDFKEHAIKLIINNEKHTITIKYDNKPPRVLDFNIMKESLKEDNMRLVMYKLIEQNPEIKSNFLG